MKRLAARLAALLLPSVLVLTAGAAPQSYLGFAGGAFSQGAATTSAYAGPTLVAAGSPTPFHGITTWAVPVGSPAANNLVVVGAACADLTATVAPSIATPAGWTRETNRNSADTFQQQALYWKIASGSEGASVNFTITSGGNIDCVSSYWKFTGHNTSDPVDATDIAWADTQTPNPPSQTVAGGPLDVYVLAFATDRGDETYSSGSDLTTNAHTDAGGISSGRTMAISHGPYTSISSKDPGTFTFAGSGARATSALTAVVYPAAVAAPTFDSGPTFAKVDNNTARMTYDASSSATLAYVALYPLTASDPSAAALIAGTGAHGTANEATTGSSDTLDVDASDSPAFPAYKVCGVLHGSGGNSAVTCNSNVPLDPPTTCGANADQPCQYLTLTSVAVGGLASVATLAYDGQTANFVVGEELTGGTSGAKALVQADTDAGATGTLTLQIESGTFQDNETLTGSVFGVAVVNGTASYIYAANDILVAPTYMMPGGSGITLTIAADGNASYTSGVERETAVNIKIYDYSADGYAAGDIDFVNNDQPPNCSGSTLLSVLTVNSAMTSFDLDNICTDAEGDTLNSIKVGTLPTGVTLNGTTNVTSGTPTVENEAGTQIRYVAYDIYGALSYRDVIFYPVTSWTVTDCTSSLTLASACATSVTALTHGTSAITLNSVSSATIASGYVVSQSPTAGSELAPGAGFTINQSIGASSTGIPSGWHTIQACLDDPDFVALMRIEANASHIWAYWLAGAVHGSANLRLNIALIEQEANGSHVWGRWDNSGIHNSGNLQLDMQTALGVGFVLSP